MHKWKPHINNFFLSSDLKFYHASARATAWLCFNMQLGTQALSTMPERISRKTHYATLSLKIPKNHKSLPQRSGAGRNETSSQPYSSLLSHYPSFFPFAGVPTSAIIVHSFTHPLAEPCFGARVRLAEALSADGKPPSFSGRSPSPHVLLRPRSY